MENADWILIAAVGFMVLFNISEALALIPSIKANSVFQAIAGVLRWVKEKGLLPLPKKTEDKQ